MRIVAALVLVLALAAATPQTTLPDVEDEVMCLECGTALNVSTAPVADRERAFIRRLIAEGRTKDEIKAALVEQFGPAVLAVPEDRGFNVAAWLVPGLLVVGGIAGVALTARRWRRSGADRPAPAGGQQLSAEDERRLDAELAAFDR
jgi:cytochrome c-type biogenesis protein CcmH